MLKVNDDGLEVPKLKGCGVCKDPLAQEITDALLCGVPFVEIEKMSENKPSTSTLSRHKKHINKSIAELNLTPLEPTNYNYPLADPSLTSDGVRLVALEEMILSAQRLRDMCKRSTNNHIKAEEAYLRALGQIESVASKLKFN